MYRSTFFNIFAVCIAIIFAASLAVFASTPVFAQSCEEATCPVEAVIEPAGSAIADPDTTPETVALESAEILPADTEPIADDTEPTNPAPADTSPIETTPGPDPASEDPAPIADQPDNEAGETTQPPAVNPVLPDNDTSHQPQAIEDPVDTFVDNPMPQAIDDPVDIFVDKPIRKPVAGPVMVRPIQTDWPTAYVTPQVYGPPNPAYRRAQADFDHMPTMLTINAKQVQELVMWENQGVDPYLLLAMTWENKTAQSGRWPALAPSLQNLTRKEAILFVAKKTTLDAARNTMRQRDLLEAMGMDALHKGLGAKDVRDNLTQRVLADKNIHIYKDGREDMEAGLVDPRLLVSLRYLRIRYHSVEVSSLISGRDGVFTRSGNISLHSYGQAVDIAALGGVRVTAASQKPGGVVQKAVTDLALLPKSLHTKEVISLWDMGAPTLALSDHDDHIHLGFANG